MELMTQVFNYRLIATAALLVLHAEQSLGKSECKFLTAGIESNA